MFATCQVQMLEYLHAWEVTYAMLCGCRDATPGNYQPRPRTMRL